MELHPLIYNVLIDPLLASVRTRIKRQLSSGQKVVDIASGTGKLVLELYPETSKVTGVDIDASMIRFSRKKIDGKPSGRISFFEADVRNLYNFEDKSFDVAIMSLALHQFDPEDWNVILTEIIRISDTIIVADYNHPLPPGYKKNIVHTIERIAGKQHYSNFLSFMKSGGVIPIAEHNSLQCFHREVSGSGIFSLYV
ncbi:MAG: class I SAM-dependent methyltransferase, partial [Bacteroidota bacterium]